MGEPREADARQGTAEGVAVGAEGFGLKGPRGWAFRGVGFDAEAGSLIAIEGPSGSGRTCLLLALTGRMKPSEGHATVGSLRLPKRMAAVRRVSALAHVPGVTDLEPALTVGEHLRERALLQRRFDGSLRGLLRPPAERAAEAEGRIEAALTAAGLDRATLPKGSRTAVRDLDRMEALRLSVALALVGRPRLLGIDDTDLKLSDAERDAMWALLRSLTESGITVVAVCSEAPAGAVVVSTAPEKRARTRTDADTAAAAHADAEDGDDTTSHTVTTDDTETETAPDTDTDTDTDKETADALAETRRA
ncbi:ATP-binding cassette domain-containing protein [Streptomyces sp. LBUM 1478]|uniref:ABC transporter domain-containing protein n=1 Tax=Streptomyces scabiei (strain 87.22) TaxID=680198 RepID=C9YTZ4_STRSW|nr:MULTISPECIES: ATP-binding cassette domain-containing protein [Streptomyces]MBP5864249.1 ATP-binding cassette domain-containing protein [Streptomyces sp. LBUM 1484]MBP5905452.1 ATP-binding cassette domain-containing protein [Streptomyces sp. LBUM 1478]MBP5932170.1 ATP-binding cassette domain-containing protein [Streptomyces sp. LBUM 1479]MBP5875117.1 ATP-binding cassette domain-containing protein [Streptomyces sp. LBUM 1477]MBP5882881.1 ATP-binding cassette domain-containing protein [Strepto